jgi:hypothetical protein
MAQKKTGVSDAKKFLDLLDADPKLKAAVRELCGVRSLGKAHGLSFNNRDLDQALRQKWGTPEKRQDDDFKVNPFTCCCI